MAAGTANNVALTFSGNGVWAGQLSTGNQVRVEFPAPAAAGSFATAATITVPLVHLNNTTFDLERSAAGDPVWRTHRDIDEFDRTPYERCSIALGSSQIVPSAPNDDFPFVYQDLGPSSLATTLDAVDLFHGTDPRSRGQYVLRQMTIGDGEPGWYFVRIARQPGGMHENLAVFHVVPRSEPAPGDGSPKPGHGLLEYHFHEGGYWPPRPFLFVQGHARGSFDSGWSMVEGTWDIIKFGATISWKTSQVRKVYRFVRNGGTLEPISANASGKMQTVQCVCLYAMARHALFSAPQTVSFWQLRCDVRLASLYTTAATAFKYVYKKAILKISLRVQLDPQKETSEKRRFVAFLPFSLFEGSARLTPQIAKRIPCTYDDSQTVRHPVRW